MSNVKIVNSVKFYFQFSLGILCKYYSNIVLNLCRYYIVSTSFVNITLILCKYCKYIMQILVEFLWLLSKNLPTILWLLLLWKYCANCLFLLISSRLLNCFFAFKSTTFSEWVLPTAVTLPLYTGVPRATNEEGSHSLLQLIIYQESKQNRV